MRRWLVAFYDERGEAIECVSLWQWTARHAVADAAKMLNATQQHAATRIEAVQAEAAL